jgi:hypothetical protein
MRTADAAAGPEKPQESAGRSIRVKYARPGQIVCVGLTPGVQFRSGGSFIRGFAMTGTQAACIVALVLLPSSLLAAPQSRSFGVSRPASHAVKAGPAFKGTGIAAHHNHFRRARFFGGYYAPYYYYYPSDDGAMYTDVVLPPEPPRAQSCQFSTQVVTVPSESGGFRDISVTRCGVRPAP